MRITSKKCLRPLVASTVVGVRAPLVPMLGVGVALSVVLGSVTPSALASATLAGRNARAEQHDHASMASPSAGETGHAAFAALAAVVRDLEDDRSTDWSRVDLGALREHLVDMDALVLRALVEQEDLGDGLLVTVSGGESVRRAARSMLPAHGESLQAERGWRVDVRDRADGAVELSVRGVADAELGFVRGLGFFGILTLGAHHEAHHVLIARGAEH